MKPTSITIQAVINAPIEKIWQFYTAPEHITQWNTASNTWHTPTAENDLTVGGKFLYRMEAKDQSAGFDFEGVYREIEVNKRIVYTMADDREVQIDFIPDNIATNVVITFETEALNPIELQREGWQAILNNFKMYVESN